MDKEKLKIHLASSTKFLIDFTKELCFNNLSENYKYIITPNGRKPYTHLTEWEVRILDVLNKYKDKILSADKTIDLSHQDNKVPIGLT